MCGIVGHVVLPGCRADAVAVRAAMNDIAHRGPDGAGLLDIDQACLGHRRLSIIDRDGSPQPWTSEDGRYTIVFNGEIYNYVELRSRLKQRGVTFRSTGDTEVLLAAFILHGKRCLEMFNGMFAFAIWDRVEGLLFAARDRVGKKPFYFALTDAGLCFSSEIAALRRFAGIERSMDPIAVHDFFAHQFVGRDRTIFSGIRKLRAGYWMTYRAGVFDTQAYWRPPEPRDDGRSLDDLAEELRALLEDSVRIRLRSDVPLGAFLSGGIDSAIICAAIKRIGADVQSFTIGFDEKSFDEARSAAATAEALGIANTLQRVECSANDVALENLRAFGEPFADPSAVPVSVLCQQARKYVSVALSGDGVDELFGGYRRYLAAEWTSWLRSVPTPVRIGMARLVLNVTRDSGQYFGSSRRKQMRLVAQQILNGAEAASDPLPQLFSPSERGKLLSPSGNGAYTFDFVTELGIEQRSLAEQMMAVDLDAYLVDDILVKVDRMSMRHGLEVRCPFLDYRIVEFACRLPMRWRIRGGLQKVIVRHAFADWLPGDVLRRPKHGFAVPLADWFRGPLRQLFEKQVLCSKQMNSLLDANFVRMLWEEHIREHRDHSLKLWGLLAFCSAGSDGEGCG